MILTSDKRPVQAKAIAHVEDAVAMAYAVRPYGGETWTVENGLQSHSFKVTDAPAGRAILIAQAIFECERYSASPMPLPKPEQSPSLHIQLVGRGKRILAPSTQPRWECPHLHPELAAEFPQPQDASAKPALPDGFFAKWMMLGALGWCMVGLVVMAVAGWAA